MGERTELECHCCGDVGAVSDAHGLYADGQGLVCGCDGHVSLDAGTPAHVVAYECPCGDHDELRKDWVLRAGENARLRARVAELTEIRVSKVGSLTAWQAEEIKRLRARVAELELAREGDAERDAALKLAHREAADGWREANARVKELEGAIAEVGWAERKQALKRAKHRGGEGG